VTTTDTFVRDTGAGRSALRMERRYPHPIDKVWRAVTSPEHLAAWFPSRVDGDFRVGGELRFAADPNLPDGTTGRVVRLDPPRVFAFTWEDDEIRLELDDDGGDGTRLTLTHTFGDTAGAASFASGWGSCLDDLDAVVDDREPPRRPPSPAEHERYVHLFHLDEGAIDTVESGWRVRFERQLTQPREEVDVALARWPDRGARRELREGTGHGPRLVVTVDAATRETAEAAEVEWRARIEELATAGANAATGG
jgi:uncharacterized protein YndB with AHSA1/START domain